jgi:hypothetical protein
MSDNHGADHAPTATPATPSNTPRRKKKADSKVEPTVKVEVTKPVAPESSDKGTGVKHLLHEGEELLAGYAFGELTKKVVITAAKFLAKKAGEHVGKAAQEHFFGSSPRDEFAIHIEAKLTIGERTRLSELLNNHEFFGTARKKAFYETVVDMFCKTDPKDSDKKITNPDGITAAQDIIKAALVRPTPEAQVKLLGSLYTSKDDLPSGKIVELVRDLSEVGEKVDAALATSGIQTAAERFRANARNRRRR